MESLPKSSSAAVAEVTDALTHASGAAAKAKDALSPAKIDAFLVHLDRVMQTPSGSDAVLATVCYGARVAAVFCTTPAGRQLISAAGYLSPSALRIMSPNEASAAAQSMYKRFNALGSLTSELRTMTRLWGMLSMYVWARALVRQLMARKKNRKSKDPVVAATSTATTFVAWTQLVSCVAYQVLENVAYLGQRGILPMPDAVQASAYRWSSRSFLVYIAAELGRLAAALAGQGGSSDADLRAKFELKRSAMRYTAFAPMTVHWGMEKGFLGESAVALLGCVPAVLQLHKVWHETAKE